VFAPSGEKRHPAMSSWAVVMGSNPAFFQTSETFLSFGRLSSLLFNPYIIWALVQALHGHIYNNYGF
jgi:hypothetical protein